ncbi:HdeD family acid-resistance protein [Paroceanicella profunda]|nr:HdeD family acid-resistance protein [Paroceanicella profunda]
MSVSVPAAAAILREAMRESVRRHSFWYLVQGGMMTLAGLCALLFPVFSSLAITLVLGWLLVIGGVMRGIGLIASRHLPYFWLQAISVLLSLLVGLFILRNTGEGLLMLTLLLIILFLIGGISRVIFALSIRPFPNWGWVLLSGSASVVLAFFLYASLPVTALWLLGVCLGIELVGEGVSLSWLAWKVRTARRPVTTP